MKEVRALKPADPFRRAASRGTTVAVLLALGAHVGIVVWLSLREPDTTVRPPALVGGGSGGGRYQPLVGGRPMTSRRVVHTFRLIDEETAKPVAGARVRDALEEQVTESDSAGIATLSARPAAALLVQIEKAGFAMHASRVANSGADSSRSHTIVMKRAPVPYYVIDTIFLMRCNHCHGNGGSAGGIDLRSHDRVMRNRFGQSPIVVPGKPDSSLLYLALTDSLPHGIAVNSHLKLIGRIPPFEIEWIKEWIREGAKNIEPAKPR